MNFNPFKKTKSSGIFIPNGDNFKELTDKVENTSLNGIAEHLGYHPDQVHVYFGNFDTDFDIQQITFEIFTNKIVFILTKNAVDKIDKEKLKYFISKYNLNEEFYSVRTLDILKSGIENKSLTIGYLSKVLGLNSSEDDGGIFLVEKLGLYLYFADNYLVDVQSADGLNEWAKHVRELNSELFGSYIKAAQKYWRNNPKMIQDEVNMQCESLSATPNALKNEFVSEHSSEFGTINFFMLLVCHYGQEINEATFKSINHGRYSQLENSIDSGKKYQYKSFEFYFSDNGELIEIIEPK